jgi:hypothetical protein
MVAWFPVIAKAEGVASVPQKSKRLQCLFAATILALLKNLTAP